MEIIGKINNSNSVSAYNKNIVSKPNSDLTKSSEIFLQNRELFSIFKNVLKNKKDKHYTFDNLEEVLDIFKFTLNDLGITDEQNTIDANNTEVIAFLKDVFNEVDSEIKTKEKTANIKDCDDKEKIEEKACKQEKQENKENKDIQDDVKKEKIEKNKIQKIKLSVSHDHQNEHQAGFIEDISEETNSIIESMRTKESTFESNEKKVAKKNNETIENSNAKQTTYNSQMQKQEDMVRKFFSNVKKTEKKQETVKQKSVSLLDGVSLNSELVEKKEKEFEKAKLRKFTFNEKLSFRLAEEMIRTISLLKKRGINIKALFGKEFIEDVKKVNNMSPIDALNEISKDKISALTSEAEKQDVTMLNTIRVKYIRNFLILEAMQFSLYREEKNKEKKKEEISKLLNTLPVNMRELVDIDTNVKNRFYEIMLKREVQNVLDRESIFGGGDLLVSQNGLHKEEQKSA